MKFNTRLLGGLLAVAGTTNAAITLDLNSTGEFFLVQPVICVSALTIAL